MVTDHWPRSSVVTVCVGLYPDVPVIRIRAPGEADPEICRLLLFDRLTLLLIPIGLTIGASKAVVSTVRALA